MNTIISFIKMTWLGFWLGLVTLTLGLAAIISGLFTATGNFQFRLSRVYTWVILVVTGVKTKIRGDENIKKGQTYIIISNHQSHFDALALISTLGIQFRWVAKKELSKIPVFGQGLSATRAIFVDRSNKRIAIDSIRNGIKQLPKGVSVLFFAEGTRSSNGEIRPFKKGGFMAGMLTGTPILPVTINGSRKILPKGSLVFHSGTIEVVVGEPINTQNYTKKNLNELIELTRNAVISNHKSEN